VQIAEAFLAAHPDRKIPKKWVGDKLKELADWQGTGRGWSLKPAALLLLGGGPAVALAVAAAEAGPAAAAAPSEAAAPAMAAVAPPSAPAVEPTPATAKPASGTAGIERFFKKVRGPSVACSRFVISQVAGPCSPA
jgi:hypothetical protein